MGGLDWLQEISTNSDVDILIVGYCSCTLTRWFFFGCEQGVSDICECGIGSCILNQENLNGVGQLIWPQAALDCQLIELSYTVNTYVF